jgi:hypothetical protein
MAQCISDELNLKCPMFKDEDYLFNSSVLNEKINLGEFDYLIVNSYCLSGQIKWSPDQQDKEFLKLIDWMKQNNKTFITTQKLENDQCTRDFDLNLVQIGQLSKYCKNIFGVPTSPYLICLNVFAFDQYETIINLTHDITTFEFGEKFCTINSIDEFLENYE